MKVGYIHSADPVQYVQQITSNTFLVPSGLFHVLRRYDCVVIGNVHKDGSKFENGTGSVAVAEDPGSGVCETQCNEL